MSTDGRDPVRPSNDVFESTFKRGYQTWSRLHEMAQEEGCQRTILQSIRTIDSAIQHYPVLPAHLDIFTPVHGHALASGSFTWGFEPQKGEAQPLTQDMRLQLGFPFPLKVGCTLDGDNQRGEFPSSREANHLPNLFAAWAYVLAARWAELLPESAIIRYTACEDGSLSPEETPLANESLQSFVDVEDKARYWWQRVLLHGSGWEARLIVRDERELHSPWSMIYERRRGEKRRRGPPQRAGTISQPAPSFSEALAYLMDYTNQQCVNDLSRAALAAALFMPVARHDQRELRLSNVHLFPTDSATDVETPAFEPTSALIDRLILLSCKAFGMTALMHSTFYEPGLDCNLAGAWTQGLMRIMNGCDTSVQLAMLILRDPDIGFLWVGAYLTGADRTCFRQVCRGFWRVDLNVGALTGTAMSFAQEEVVVDHTVSSLSRADECKMRYLCHAHFDAPSFAFPPFGTTALADLDLDLRLQLSMYTFVSIHLEHVFWQTTLPETTALPLDVVPLRRKQGQALQTMVKATVVPSAEERIAAEECSKNTTRIAFGWLREAPVVRGQHNASETSVFVEGGISWSNDEREIFEHEWLR